VVVKQRNCVLRQAENRYRTELDVIGTAIIEPLLWYQYDEIEQFLLNWGRETDNVATVTAIRPNVLSWPVTNVRNLRSLSLLLQNG
jgi:hypothetical protein